MKKFYLTDDNCIHGVARRWAEFFLPNNKEFTDDFQVGKRVHLDAAIIREITRIEAADLYLNINVSGDLLDPGKVGSPDKFFAINQPLFKSILSNK